MESNYSVKSRRPKQPEPGVAAKYVAENMPVMIGSEVEQQAGHCRHSAGRKTDTCAPRMLSHDVRLHSNNTLTPGIRCHKSRTRTRNNEPHLNSANVASQLSKSSCHPGTFQQECLKGDSCTPFLPPSFFSLVPRRLCP